PARAPVAGEVERDDAVVGGEALHRLGPPARVAEPAVHEDERRVAAPAGAEVDAHAVGGEHGVVVEGGGVGGRGGGAAGGEGRGEEDEQRGAREHPASV